jgi:hypothetical protein
MTTFLLMLATALPGGGEKKTNPNTLTPKEVAEGWVLLFDGETTFGWEFKGEAKVQGGTLVLGGTKETTVSTTTRFAVFELAFEYLAEVPPPGGPGPAVRLDIGPRRTHGLTLFRGRWGTIRSSITFDLRAGSRRGRTVEEPLAKGGRGLSSGGFDDRDEPVPTSVQFTVPTGTKLSLRSVKLRPLGLKLAFNGKDLTGWKEVPGKKSKFSVKPEGWLNVKDGPGDLQTEAKWGDFVLQLDCVSNGTHLNSGVFFRAVPGKFWSGYEAQIRNQWKGDRKKPVDYGTGGLYGLQPARKVVSSDKEWFTLTVAAHGRHIAIWVNGYQTVDFTDDRNGANTGPGPVSLQGHDPTTDLSFRNIRVADLKGK